MDKDKDSPFYVPTLQEIMGKEYPTPKPVIKGLLAEGEVNLFIARQKEGKSTLALQLAIDVANGDDFLAHYSTTKTGVLYVDYENKYYRLKKRGKDLSNGRLVENLRVRAFERIIKRNLGLFGDDFKNLFALVKEYLPGLLIIDPLRYATRYQGNRGTSDESFALAILDSVSLLRR